MTFRPYTRDQLVQIVEARLRVAADSTGARATAEPQPPVLHPAAVRLCAAKVVSVSGDVRQALELCRRTLEISQRDKRPQIAIMSALFR